MFFSGEFLVNSDKFKDFCDRIFSYDEDLDVKDIIDKSNRKNDSIEIINYDRGR